MGFDSRRIQTAVLGHAESDEPLVCPTDAAELDVFREEYREGTIWCGLLLGGCGMELHSKRCKTKVCHFAHMPTVGEAPVCNRRARGSASADHLYVKAATRAMLQQRGHQPRYRFVTPPDTPIASVVEISLGEMLLRVHMDPNLAPDWDQLGSGQLILGPGVPVDQRRLVERRYVQRIRFETTSSSRKMWVGTQVPHAGSEWFAPEECEVVDGQLQTPLSARVTASATPPQEPQAPPPVPVTDPAVPAPRDSPRVEEDRVPVQIGKLVRQLRTALRSEETTVARRLYGVAGAEKSRCTGTALRELETVSLEAGAWLQQQDRLRTLLFTRLEEAGQHGDIQATRALQAQIQRLLKLAEAPTEAESAALDAATRLLTPRPVHQPPSPPTRRRTQASRRERAVALANARQTLRRLRSPKVTGAKQKRLVNELKAAVETADDWLSPQELSEAAAWVKHMRRDNKQKQPQPRTDRQKPPARRQKQPRADRLSPETLEAAAAAVRGALKKAAREQTTTTWSRLQSQLGRALPQMGSADRTQLLVLVDRPTPPDKALLSSLLAAGDPGMACDFRYAAAELGLEPPEDDDDLQDVLRADAELAQDDWAR